MKLFLIRHAQSRWNLLEKVQGNRNPRLSDIGILQAKALAYRLAKEKVDIIYSSPLLRSLQTAKMISRIKKRPINVDVALREFMLGDWEGKTVKELNARYCNLYDKWLESPSSVRIPNAERFNAFKRRVLDFFKKLFKHSSKNSVAVVTHGGVIYVVLSYILKIDFDGVFKIFRLDNASLTRIDIEEKTPYIWYVNDTSHLKWMVTNKYKGLWEVKNRIRV